MKIVFDKLQKGSFFFGDKVLPKIFEKLGIPMDKATTAAGHSGLWTGLLLGAGGALMAAGAVIGAISGGALIAPTMMGSILMHGALSVAAMAIGNGLFRAGESALGFSLLDKAKQFFSFFTKSDDKPKEKDITPPAASFESLPAFNMTKRLTNNFKNAVSNENALQLTFKKPAFNGPATF